MSSTIELRDDQVEAVIAEALAQEFFEAGPDGSLPADIDDRRKAAVDLVRQSVLSSAVGNDHPGVAALLRIAEVGSGPVTPPPPEGDIMAATDAEQLAAQPNEMLPKLLQTLSGFEQTDDVKENVALIRAEMERRGLPIPVTSAPAASTPAAEPVQEQPPAAAETPQVTRQDLEDRLTFPMMRAHEVDPSQIESLTDEQLQLIIDNPAGPPDAPQAAETQQEEPVQDPGDVIQTTRMVTTPPESDPVPAPAAPPTIAEQNGASSVSSQREDLEAQITGPILKVYGRGRTDVPEIGDAELGFMIANPDGRVTLEALEAAKALDRGESVLAHDLETDNDDDAQPTIASQKREAKAQTPPAASQDVHSPASASAFAPAAEVVEEVPPTSAPSSASPDPAPAAEPSAPPAASGGRVTQRSALNRELPENPAQSIIDRENFPVPPTLDDTPPRLPFDLSKCSDEQIASFHSQFHSCSNRMNYVVGLWDSELRDAVKLRKGREVEVANDLPAKDGRTKLTDAQREAMVQADDEVVRLRGEEHEIEKVLRQLRVLADNYSRDVSVCSRENSMRHREAEGVRA